MKSIGLMLGFLCAASFLGTGCQSAGKEEASATTGAIELGLKSFGSAGEEFRLRNATFSISPTYYYYYDSYPGMGGSSGSTTAIAPVIVSSEEDLTATSISVDLEQGSYYVTLQPGWTMEKITDGVAETVPAVLLPGYSTSQYAYVSPHSSTSVQFGFGIGGRDVWFNGKLNVEMKVYSDPDEYYGSGGNNGFGGSGGNSYPQPAGGATFKPVIGAGGNW